MICGNKINYRDCNKFIQGCACPANQVLDFNVYKTQNFFFENTQINYILFFKRWNVLTLTNALAVIQEKYLNMVLVSNTVAMIG